MSHLFVNKCWTICPWISFLWLFKSRYFITGPFPISERKISTRSQVLSPTLVPWGREGENPGKEVGEARLGARWLLAHATTTTWNYPPTPPLSQHYKHLLLTLGKILGYGRSRWAVSQKRIMIQFPLSLGTRLLILKNTTLSPKKRWKPGMMRDTRAFCEVVHSKKDSQIFAWSQKGTFTSRMTNVFFGYGGVVTWFGR